MWAVGMRNVSGIHGVQPHAARVCAFWGVLHSQLTADAYPFARPFWLAGSRSRDSQEISWPTAGPKQINKCVLPFGKLMSRP